MINPILASSALRRMRSVRTLLILAAYVLVLLVVTLGVMSQLLSSDIIAIDSMRDGMNAYILLLMAQFALMILVAPAMTSSSIAGERERQTLELLLVTNTGSWRIAFGKLMESFCFLVLLTLCALPVVSLTMMTGGVTLGQILMGELFILVCGFAAASVGVLCSSLMRNTVGATIVSYIVLLVIGVGTILPMVNGITNSMAGRLYDANSYAAMTALDGVKMMPKLLMVNPGIGLVALLEEQTGLIQSLWSSGWGRVYATLLMMRKIGCGRLAVINMLSMTALAMLCNAVAALLVRPRRVKIRRKA